MKRQEIQDLIKELRDKAEELELRLLQMEVKEHLKLCKYALGMKDLE